MVERYPNLKEEVSSSIPGCQISSLFDKNLPSGQLPHVLWRWPVNLMSQKKMGLAMILGFGAWIGFAHSASKPIEDAHLVLARYTLARHKGLQEVIMENVVEEE